MADNVQRTQSDAFAMRCWAGAEELGKRSRLRDSMTLMIMVTAGGGAAEGDGGGAVRGDADDAAHHELPPGGDHDGDSGGDDVGNAGGGDDDGFNGW
eukprot:3275476-Rhodomonas_salina.1